MMVNNLTKESTSLRRQSKLIKCVCLLNNPLSRIRDSKIPSSPPLQNRDRYPLLQPHRERIHFHPDKDLETHAHAITPPSSFTTSSAPQHSSPIQNKHKCSKPLQWTSADPRNISSKSLLTRVLSKTLFEVNFPHAASNSLSQKYPHSLKICKYG